MSVIKLMKVAHTYGVRVMLSDCKKRNLDEMNNLETSIYMLIC